MPWTTVARLPWICALVAAVGLTVGAGGCRPKAPDTAVAPEGGPTMADEAAKLPGFDMAGEQPQQRGDVPFERFFVELGDAPVRGPATAPVTIVAFSDFEWST